MTMPIHRVNAQIFTIRPIDEDQLYEDVKRIYNELGVISTQIIIDKFCIDFKLALNIMSKIIKDDL